MTTIDVDTSPLEAAREWRGMGLVAAAMNAGLPVSQAQALEEGDPGAFGSIDEMIAAAVVYGATIGIGRDEAVALLDRTACRTGPQVELPDTRVVADAVRPGSHFSGAVQARSAHIASRTSHPAAAGGSTLMSPSDTFDGPAASVGQAPGHARAGDRSQLASGATGELQLDSEFGPEAPWERAAGTSELEAWAGGYADADEDSWAEAPRPGSGTSVSSRITTGFAASLERVLGTDRADAVMERISHSADAARALARDGRDRLRRSEHATLIVAIGAGAVLIALLVALGGAIGSDEPTAQKQDPAPQAEAEAGATGPAVAPAEPGTPADTATRAESTPPAGRGDASPPRPMVAPRRLTLDIYNAGSRKGYAKEVAAKLGAAGYRIGEVTNAQGRYTGATIIHPRDLAREARVLARRSGISTLQVAPGTSRRITIVVT